MKYDFLVREKLKNNSDETSDNKYIRKNEDGSFIGSTMLSTYDDFNIFIKKTQHKNNIDDMKNNIDDMKNNIDDDKDSKKKINNDSEKKIDDDSEKKIDNNKNSTLFESEKKTVETIVKYSSSFINLLLKLVFILKNVFLNLISKKKINTESNKDKEIIDKFNKHLKKNIVKKKEKYLERKDKSLEKKNKSLEKKNYKQIEKKDDKHIKKMNSYLLELD